MPLLQCNEHRRAAAPIPPALATAGHSHDPPSQGRDLDINFAPRKETRACERASLRGSQHIFLGVVYMF